MFQLNFVILSKVQGLIQYPSLLGYNNIFRATIQCNLITTLLYFFILTVSFQRSLDKGNRNIKYQGLIFLQVTKKTRND